MITYYNIHTHFPSDHSDEVTIVNRIIKGTKMQRGEKGERDFLSVGIHPWYIDDAEKQIKQLREFSIFPEVVAIGEAGLDKLTDTSFDIQQQVFIQQTNLAEELQKPLIIHCVKAWQELIAIKKQINPGTAWIIHGFRGKPDLAEQLLHQGFYLSFGEHFNPEALSVSWESTRLFAETDDATINIRSIYQQIATTLHISKEEIARQIQRNFHLVFFM